MNYSDLTRLFLSNMSYQQVPTTPKLQLQYLKEIHFVPSYAPTTQYPAVPLPLLSVLLSQPNITILGFTLPIRAPLDYAKGCLSVIEAHASKIIIAYFGGLATFGGEQDVLEERIAHFFGHFTRLEILEVGWIDMMVMDCIPKSTEMLTIECGTSQTPTLGGQQMWNSVVSPTFVAMLEGAEAKLGWLTMKYAGGNFEGWVGFRDVTSVCAKKGIELRWIGAWDQDLSE